MSKLNTKVNKYMLIGYLRKQEFIVKNCNHISSGLRLIDFGRDKTEHCIKCSKCLKMLSDYEKR